MPNDESQEVTRSLAFSKSARPHTYINHCSKKNRNDQFKRRSSNLINSLKNNMIIDNLSLKNSTFYNYSKIDDNLEDKKDDNQLESNLKTNNSLHINPRENVKLKSLYLESTNQVTFTGNLGAVDPKHLARHLFNLIHVQKDQISRILCRGDAFHREACKEYMNLFDLTNLTIDDALRMFMEKIPFIGETHSIERMLRAFSARYWRCNNDNLDIPESACHLIMCSLLILNSDLTTKIKMKKMTQKEYIKNILEACNKNEKFPSIQLLKNLYTNIKKIPLPEVIAQDSTNKSKRLSKIASNEQHSSIEEEFTDQMSSPLFFQKKSFTHLPSFFLTRWILYFASLKGLELFLYKEPYRSSNIVVKYNIAHCYASEYNSKRIRYKFVLYLQNGQEFLVRTASRLDCTNWITHLNVSAAMLSIPQLPISVGNPPFFIKRGLYPATPYTGSIIELLKSWTNRENELRRILEQNQLYKAKKRERHNHKVSIVMLCNEVVRMRKYSSILETTDVNFLSIFLHPKNGNGLENFAEYLSKV